MNLTNEQKEALKEYVGAEVLARITDGIFPESYVTTAKEEAAVKKVILEKAIKEGGNKKWNDQ